MQKINYLVLLLTFLFYTTHLLAQPPKPEAGKRWVLNPDFSDEFNGNELDQTKWYNNHPNWKGRPPGIFLSSQVAVEDGFLKIKGEKLKKDTVVNGKTFTIAGGAVVSKNFIKFGYFESRFKAASTTMSTTFWFSTKKHAAGPIGCGDRYGLEWDIQECIGRSGDFKGNWFAKGMHSNSHYWYSDCDKKRHDHRAKDVRFDDKELASTKFNTYGGWWKDENTAVYYFNDEEPKTQKFYDILCDKPFNLPMSMNLVSETYPFPWIELPTDKELADDSKNTCYYDWVRSYKLVNIKEPYIKGEKAQQELGQYQDNVKIEEPPRLLTGGKTVEIQFTYQTNENRNIRIELRDTKSNLVCDSIIMAYSGYGNSSLRLELSKPLSGKKYKLISSVLPIAAKTDKVTMSETIDLNFRGWGFEFKKEK